MHDKRLSVEEYTARFCKKEKKITNKIKTKIDLSPHIAILRVHQNIVYSLRIQALRSPALPVPPPKKTNAATALSHPAEEASQVGQPPCRHLFQDYGEVVSFAPLRRGLELHQERLALRGKRQLAGRDHNRTPVVGEGDALKRRGGVLLLELLEDCPKLRCRLSV